MDIFELAQQGMKIQEEEKQNELEEINKQKKEKTYKIDIQEALIACANKDYSWFYRLGEHQKNFQPFILNMWLSQVFSPNKEKKIDTVDLVYSEIVQTINNRVNANLFLVPKGMIWLLACTVNEYNLDRFNLDWVKSLRKSSTKKIDPKILDYLVQELWTSRDKIIDMIDNGLITDEDIKAIQKDLETLEEPKKKKNNKDTK